MRKGADLAEQATAPPTVGVQEPEQPDIGHRTRLPGPIFLMTETLQTGGTERQFSLAARALERDFSIHLGCAARRGSFAVDIGQIPEFETGRSMVGPTALRSTARLVRYLRRHNVVLAHAFDFYTNLMLVPAARIAGVPVVIGSQRQLGDLLSAAKRLAQLSAFHLCDAVVCNSQATAARLCADGVKRSKLVVLPNYLPDEAFGDVVPALPRKDGVLRVGMVARMNNPVKNHSLLLKAVAGLSARFPGLELVLAGDGPLRPGLESQARELGISRRVLFLGDRRDVTAVLRSLDIAVLTSDSESLSNAILEAMATGLPVVASRVGGNIELVREGETGLLFSPGEQHGLEKALETLLLSKDLRHRAGVQGRTYVRAHFNMDSVLAQFRNLYLSLLKKKAIV
jgi:L-malate glycosyltransferase